MITFYASCEQNCEIRLKYDVPTVLLRDSPGEHALLHLTHERAHTNREAKD